MMTLIVVKKLIILSDFLLRIEYQSTSPEPFKRVIQIDGRTSQTLFLHFHRIGDSSRPLSLCNSNIEKKYEYIC